MFVDLNQYFFVASCISTHCNTLQHTTKHRNLLQHTAAQCSTLQHAATRCNTLQHTATHDNTLQHTTTHCNTLQHTAFRRLFASYQQARNPHQAPRASNKSTVAYFQLVVVQKQVRQHHLAVATCLSRATQLRTGCGVTHPQHVSSIVTLLKNSWRADC